MADHARNEEEMQLISPPSSTDQGDLEGGIQPKEPLKEAEPGCLSWFFTGFWATWKEGLFFIWAPQGKGTIPAFVGMRGFAALWVSWYHFYHWSGPGDANDIYWLSPLSFMVSKAEAIDLFFFMSGFLMTHLLSKEHAFSGMKTGRFLFRRTLRMAPSAWVETLLFRAASFSDAIGLRQQLREACQKYWWAGFLFIQNYLEEENMCPDLTWTVSLEFQLYVGTVFFMKLVTRNRRAGWTVLAIALIISPAIRAYVTYKSGLLWMERGPPAQAVYFHTLLVATHSRYATYIMGMMVSFWIDREARQGLWADRNPAARIDWLTNPLHKPSWRASAINSVIVVAMVLVVGVGSYPLYERPVMVKLLHLTFFNLVFGALLAIATYRMMSGQFPIANTLLGLRMWVPFANLSFGYYLYHMASIFAVNRLFGFRVAETNLQWLGWTVVYMLGALLMGSLNFTFIEYPSIKYRKRIEAMLGWKTRARGTDRA